MMSSFSTLSLGLGGVSLNTTADLTCNSTAAFKPDGSNSDDRMSHEDSPEEHVGSSHADEAAIQELYRAVPEVRDLYRVRAAIGEGTFSEVYRAVFRRVPRDLGRSLPGDEFALKHIRPACSSKRYALELDCLTRVGGCCNVMGTTYVHRNQDHVVIVMPRIDHKPFSTYFRQMDEREVRTYMRALMTALIKVHAYQVIHRDIKPSNFLYDRNKNIFALLDFGLAQMTHGAEGDRPAIPRGSTFTCKCRDPATPTMDPSHPFWLCTAPGTPGLKESQGDKENKTENINGKMEKGRKLIESQHDVFSSPPLFVVPKVYKPRKDKQKAKPARTYIPEVQQNPKEACKCFGRPETCRVCRSWQVQHEQRAGTPGFRAPEVLIKYDKQSTALDMWSAGVIFLSALSGRYPFFTQADDLVALAEIAAVVGPGRLAEAAKACGKHLQFSSDFPEAGSPDASFSLRRLCSRLQSASRREPLVPDNSAAYDLLARLLDPNPHSRISAADALAHPFLADGN